MADPQVNFFKSTLVGTYSDTDTSITIATGDGALLPDPSTDGAFNLTIFEGLQVTGSTEFEIVRVTARSGDVLTVTRGQESTTPLTIGSATHSILMSATKKTFDDINDAIANVDLTTLTNVEELTFDSTGDEEFGLPAGTTAQRPSSPSQGYMRYNTSDGIGVEVYNGNRWVSLGAGFVGLALDVAQLSVTANDAVAENILEVEYLVVAGGGGGGGGVFPGGGGAGGYRSSVNGESSGGGASAESVFEADLDTSYTVTVGAGGAVESNGANSVFSTVSSTGGGKAGKSDGPGTNNVIDAGDGGSGGGSSSNGTTTGNGSGTANQGFDGGFGGGDIPQGVGGGGGGASQAGQDGGDNTGGNGGDGVSSSITGSAVTRAGGGGGGTNTAGTNPGTGGAGGGGNGGIRDATDGEPGDANTGGGGGSGANGGSGGSGIVILKYPDTFTISVGAGLTSSTSTSGGYSVTQFTQGTDTVSFSTT